MDGETEARLAVAHTDALAMPHPHETLREGLLPPHLFLPCNWDALSRLHGQGCCGALGQPCGHNPHESSGSSRTELP